MSTKNKYNPELKAEAIKLVNEQGLTLAQAGEKLGIPKGTIAGWVSGYTASAPGAPSGAQSYAELKNENIRLRKEPAHLSHQAHGQGLRGFTVGVLRVAHQEASARAVADTRLMPLIVKIREESRKTYGPRRMKDELEARGVHVGRDRIGRICKSEGIECIQRRKFKATTYSQHDLPTEPNLLAQGFAGHVPGEVWGTDITYIPTDEGWLYLAGVKDFGGKEIVGRAMGERMTKDLVRDALRKALAFRTPKPGCIHHSDRGVQYCSHEYRADVAAAGFRVSMSRKGNCYDNAPTESFWGTLKQELVHHRHYATRTEARDSIQEYIEIFYNRVRRHSVIGNMAPSKYVESYSEGKSLRLNQACPLLTVPARVTGIVCLARANSCRKCSK